MSLEFMKGLDDGKIIYATFIESILQSMSNRYVKEGCEVLISSGLSVVVSTGKVWYNGLEYDVNNTTITLNNALSNKDRADVIVWDYNNGNPELKVITGTRHLALSNNTIIPLTDRINEQQIPLAIVIVRQGATEIVPTDIIDVRSYSEGGSAIIRSSSEINDKYKLWFDTTSGRLKVYDTINEIWRPLKYSSYISYTNFDNNNDGNWIEYINISIISSPLESIQYKIEIVNDDIKIYSNDLNNILVSGNGGNVFWNNVQNDGRDIRVFDESYNQNYFWIEEFDYTNKKAIIWVKINAGQEQVNIAFGNNDCSMSSFNNGDMTFEFFDDFEGDSLDMSKWTIGNTGSYELNNGNIKIISDFEPCIIANYNIPNNFIISARVWVDNSHVVNSICYGIGTHDSNGVYEVMFVPFYTNILYKTRYYNGNVITLGVGSYSYTSNTPVIFTISVNEPNMKYILDNQEIYSITSFDLTQVVTKQLYLFSILNRYGYVDWIFIRKYISNDLQFGIPNIQEF